MKLSKLFVLMLAVSGMFFMTGCSDTDDDPTTLADYLVDENLDLPDILTDWIITASAVYANLDNYYVIDARNQAAYDAGHIPGAVFADASTILDVATDNGGKDIIVHCFKGIGATKLVVALRLSGYPTAKSMKFGMSAWHTDNDVWTGATSDTAEAYPNAWVTTGDPAAVTEYDLPIIATEEVDDGAEALEARVAYLLDTGYGYASPIVALENHSDYFINNYWDAAAWDTYGHLVGSYRVYDDAALSLENGGIANMNPDAKVLTYCWTSQTSGMITAYLTVLGFDAYSLSTGANGMIHGTLTSHKWSAANGTAGENAPGDYPKETD